MSINIANTEISNTFDFWRIRTNELATAMRYNVVTVNNPSSGLTTTPAVGDAEIVGQLSANSIKVDSLSSYAAAVITVNSANLVISGSSGLVAQGPVDVQGIVTFQTVNNMRIVGANTTHQFLAANSITNVAEFRKIEFPIDQLTDVETSNVAPGARSNNSILVWNTATSNWITGSIATRASMTITALTSNTIAAVSGSLNLSSNNVLSNTMWTFTTNRVGINTNAPVSALTVNGAITATGDVQAFYTSDKTFKKNIKEVQSGFGIETLDKLTVKEFDWNEKKVKKSEYVADRVGHDVGLIAQEVQEVLPFLVQTRPDGTLAVDYVRLIPYLMASIKDLQAQILELKNGSQS